MKTKLSTRAINPEELDEPKYVYMCGVYFQHELKDVPHRVTFFKTLKALKQEMKCTRQCGAVKLKVELVDWVIPQNFKD